MKRTVFVLVLLGLFCSTCFGAEYAVDKGANMLSLAGAYVSTSGDLYENSRGESYHALLLMSSVVHFYPRNFGIGSDLFFLHAGQGKVGLTSIGVGPKIMYFFGGKEDKTYPYLTSGLYYVSNYISEGRSHDSVYGCRVKLGGGFSRMITTHLGLVVEASYNLDNFRDEDSDESTSGNMAVISLGLAGFTF